MTLPEFPNETPTYIHTLDSRLEARHDALSSRVDALSDRMGGYENREALCEFKVFGENGVRERLAAVETRQARTDERVSAVETDIRESLATVRGGWKTAGWLFLAASSVAGAIKMIWTHIHPGVTK